MTDWMKGLIAGMLGWKGFLFIATSLFVQREAVEASNAGDFIKFTKPPSAKVSLYGSRIILHCYATSTLGQVQIRWYHGNREIKHTGGVYRIKNSGGLLIINHLTFNEAGTYHCVASSKLGAIHSSKAQVKIYDAVDSLTISPTYQEWPRNWTSGHSVCGVAVFTCTASVPAHSAGAVILWQAMTSSGTWRHLIPTVYGSSLQPGYIIFQNGNQSTLQIQCPFSDGVKSTMFRCYVEGMQQDNMVVSTPATIKETDKSPEDIWGMSVYAQRMRSVTVQAGSKLTLPCVLRQWALCPGPSQTPVKWYIGDKKPVLVGPHSMPAYLVGGGNLVISDVPRDGKLNYQCVARTSCSAEETTDVDVNVLKPPQFVIQPPQTAHHNVGQILTLTCKASGSPIPHIHWLLNAERIVRDPAKDFFSDDNLTMYHPAHGESVLKLSLPHNSRAMVQCEAVNSVGHNQTATLVTAFSPAKISVHPSDTTVFKGGAPQLQCDADGHPNNYHFFWHHNGQLIQNNSRFAVLQDGSLEISDVRMSDRGDYICSVSNGQGQAASSRRALLKVLRGFPVIEDFSVNMSVVENSSHFLHCFADGKPMPKIEWLRKDASSGSYTKTRFKMQQNSELSLEKLKISDSGLYACQARNHHGVDERIISVFVGRPPRIKIMVNSKRDDRQLDLSCEVNGIPMPAVQWRVVIRKFGEKDTVRLQPGNSFVLPLFPQVDKVFLSCQANNTVGKAVKSFTWNRPLVTTFPPTTPTTLPVNRVTSRMKRKETMTSQQPTTPSAWSTEEKMKSESAVLPVDSVPHTPDASQGKISSDGHVSYQVVLIIVVVIVTSLLIMLVMLISLKRCLRTQQEQMLYNHGPKSRVLQRCSEKAYSVQPASMRLTMPRSRHGSSSQQLRGRLSSRSGEHPWKRQVAMMSVSHGNSCQSQVVPLSRRLSDALYSESNHSSSSEQYLKSFDRNSLMYNPNYGKPLPISPPYRSSAGTFFFPPTAINPSTPGVVARSFPSCEELEVDDGSYEDMRPVGYNSDFSSSNTQTPSPSLPRTMQSHLSTPERVGSYTQSVFSDEVDTDSFSGLMPSSTAASRDSSLRTNRTSSTIISYQSNEEAELQEKLDVMLNEMNTLAKSFDMNSERRSSASTPASITTTPGDDQEKPLHPTE